MQRYRTLCMSRLHFHFAVGQCNLRYVLEQCSWPKCSSRGQSSRYPVVRRLQYNWWRYYKDVHQFPDSAYTPIIDPLPRLQVIKYTSSILSRNCTSLAYVWPFFWNSAKRLTTCHGWANRRSSGYSGSKIWGSSSEMIVEIFLLLTKLPLCDFAQPTSWR